MFACLVTVLHHSVPLRPGSPEGNTCSLSEVMSQECHRFFLCQGHRAAADCGSDCCHSASEYCTRPNFITEREGMRKTTLYKAKQGV